MCADHPSSEEIIKAVKSSGYLMEQEVASIIESLGFHVQTNKAFADLDEGTSREIDVAGIKEIYKNEANNTVIIAEILCETKNNQNPFVFIGRNKTAADKLRTPKEYIFPIPSYEVDVSSANRLRAYREISAFNYLSLSSNHYDFIKETKAVQFCKIVRDKKSWKANHDGVYYSIFYPLVKCLLSRKKDILKFSTYRYIWLFFPIVVLNSSIYYIDSTASAITPEAKGYVTFVRELKNKSIDGKFSVDFVSKEYLPRFVSECILPFAESIIPLCESSTDLWNNKQNPLGITL